jgi:hypothetical protein
MDDMFRHLEKMVEEKGGSLVLMTLTAKYNPRNLTDIFNSWKRIAKKWQGFKQWLQRNDFSSFICVKEAHETGGCHIHLIIYYSKELKTTIDKYHTFRMADKEFEQRIKEAWSNRFYEKTKTKAKADIQIVQEYQGASAYISKELGKESHIETALKRCKRDWTGKGDEAHKIQDIKKLWGWYIADILNLRRWNMSHVKKAKALDKEAIDNSIEVSNDDNNDKTTGWYFVIPKSDIKKGLISKKLGKVKKNTPEYWRIMYYSTKYPDKHKLPKEETEKQQDITRMKIRKRLNDHRKIRLLAMEAVA